MNHPITTTADRVRRIICDVLAESGVVLSFDDLVDTDVLSARGADPLDVMHVVYALEETFGISIDDDAFDTGSTVAGVIAAVRQTDHLSRTR
jgi:acyl carrier protein